ncbi:pleckstrin homology domain-containing family F member 1-like [Conger conger]|uniref:pleckstrin homology domain-containing family F member 1-like n=1 Tax=Conger conger TaxID=82655 RepID=UPI002A5AFF02|nr:pleckstrin homology domain-containing family F member 1-like [Conger conger]
MAAQLTSTEDNLARILAVESSFGRYGKPLKKPGRVLVGEGCLTKLCKRSPQPRVFFLFNDILVYGSIIVQDRLYTGQKVIQLEDLMVESLEDSPDMKNQWLLRTPSKSFYVSAASPQEKASWITHIEECRTKRVNERGQGPVEDFAPSWIPDKASAICMRCCTKFSFSQRRHHCRQCGILVCGSCSSQRFLIPNISREPVRVCQVCFQNLQAKEFTRNRGDSGGNSCTEETSSDEDAMMTGSSKNALRGWTPYSHE